MPRHAGLRGEAVGQCPADRDGPYPGGTGTGAAEDREAREREPAPAQGRDARTDRGRAGDAAGAPGHGAGRRITGTFSAKVWCPSLRCRRTTWPILSDTWSSGVCAARQPGSSTRNSMYVISMTSCWSAGNCPLACFESASKLGFGTMEGSPVTAQTICCLTVG